MKNLNCSTWNKLKISLSRFFVSALALFSGFVGLSLPASAGAVAVPVTAELIAELLVALGVLSGSAAAGYVLSEDCDPYTATILEQQIGVKLSHDIPIAETTVEEAGLLGTVIPEDLYTTDGSNFFVADRALTNADLFVRAESLVGISYKMPTNVSGAQYQIGNWTSSIGNHWGIASLTTPQVNSNYFYVPFVASKTGYYIFSCATSFPSISERQYYYLTRNELKSVSGLQYTDKLGTYLYYPIQNNNNGSDFLTSSRLDGGDGIGSVYPSVYINVTGSSAFEYSVDNQHCLLRLTGTPVYTLEGDKAKLSDSIVQVKKDDDDNNGSTPPVPQSPNDWELWKGIQDLVQFIDSGDDTNNGTTLGDFVNNNYNYVDVDINVPDTINNNVNLSGGLDINGSGDVNITIHEDVSLPSAGDGSGFYNPDVTDVVGALGKDNPVIDVVSALFSALDPALVGIFSVSVSLLFVLGLWKLIRG